MDHEEFKKARHSLGLSLSELGRMLGPPGNPMSEGFVRKMENPPEHARHKDVSKAVERLMLEYLDGYRPRDWPKSAK